MDEACRDDKEIVLEAVRRQGYCLRVASKACRGDREIVFQAVRQNGRSLRHASETCRGDKELVLEAVRQHGQSLHFASEACCDDKDIVLDTYDELRARANGRGQPGILQRLELVFETEDAMARGGDISALQSVRAH